MVLAEESRYVHPMNIEPRVLFAADLNTERGDPRNILDPEAVFLALLARTNNPGALPTFGLCTRCSGQVAISVVYTDSVETMMPQRYPPTCSSSTFE